MAFEGVNLIAPFRINDFINTIVCFPSSDTPDKTGNTIPYQILTKKISTEYTSQNAYKHNII